MLDRFFLFSQFLPIEIKVFNKNFLYPIEDIDFPSSNVKSFFFKVLGVSNWQCSGLNYARFEEFVHNAERITRIIYAWRLILHNKIVPN